MTRVTRLAARAAMTALWAEEVLLGVLLGEVAVAPEVPETLGAAVKALSPIAG